MAAVSSSSSTGNAYIDGLLAGQKWASPSLTFSFPSASWMYEGGYSLSEPSVGFQAFETAQRAATLQALAGYASIANLSFTELTGSAASSATLRYGRSDKVSTGWAYSPNAEPEGGDVWVNASSLRYDAPARGSYAWMTLLHETGHALGLKHTHEASGSNGVMPTDHDSLEYTVMSYRSYAGASLTRGYVNGSGDYPQTLMLDDIRAIQQLYGANFTAAGTSVTYKWSPTTGEMSINGVAQGAPAYNKIFMTVWTGGANATYDFSNYKTHLQVDLRPGQWSTVSADQLANLDVRSSDSHMAQGNIANAYYVAANGVDDLVRNALGGAGADTILGNAADNRLQGGGGDDRIDGEGGINTAIYSSKAADYSWKTLDGSSWTVTDLRGGSPDGTDTLKNIAFLQFSDQKIGLSSQTPTPTAADLPGSAVTAAPAAGAAKSNGPAEVGMDMAAVRSVIDASKATISVANLTYQFFTGATPTQAGLGYVVSSPENPSNLMSAYYQAFSLENRYINFALNLGANGEGRSAFEGQYGALSMTEATGKAYKAIFGADPGADKLTAILGPDDAGDAYFHSFGGGDLGAKAAMVGWLLAEAVKSDTGLYAQANDAYIAEMMAGRANFGVDLIKTYGDAFKSNVGPYAPAEILNGGPDAHEDEFHVDLIGLPADEVLI